MRKNYIKIALVGLLAFSACDDSILDKSNPNQLTPNTFFQTEEQLDAAVIAGYAALQANNLYAREYFFLYDMLSGENDPSGGLEAPRRAALLYTYDAGNKLVNDVWRGLYRVINRANFVIQNIESVPEGAVSEINLNRAEAQAKFLRAWAYYNLVTLWGEVPLYTETATSPNGNPLASQEDIFAVIMADLDFAETHLPNTWEAEDAGRVKKAAAQAMKGKVHMWRAEYAQAKTEFEKIVDAGIYSLVPRYLDNFEEENENNVESIFEVQFQGDQTGNAWDESEGVGFSETTFRGQEYAPVTGWNNVNPTQQWLDIVAEDGDPTKVDPRLGYSTYQDGDLYNNGALTMDVSRPGWRKYTNAYKQPNENQFSSINFRVIRYADVLQMLAEATYLAGNGSPAAAAEAMTYINIVRARGDVALAPLPVPATEEAFFRMLNRERIAELSQEQIRLWDIRRWRKNGKLSLLGYEPLPAYKPSEHEFLPIPAIEVANNSSID